MKCENCGKNEVTFVYQSSVNGNVTEKHLCAECAEKLGYTQRLAAQSQRMKNPVNMAGTHMPAGPEEAYQASLRSLLSRNVGYFVVMTFLVGANQPVTWQGILHTVGSDYVVLYQPDYERYISGDLYSLKFVQFHNVKGVPYCAAAQNWQGHTNF